MNDDNIVTKPDEVACRLTGHIYTRFNLYCDRCGAMAIVTPTDNEMRQQQMLVMLQLAKQGAIPTEHLLRELGVPE